MSNRTDRFTQEELELLSDAIWMKQRCFIAGDKKFKEYGKLLEEFIGDSNYVPGRFK